MKYVIISNRLPVTLQREGERFHCQRSSGGLATGLDSLETKAEKHWIGWPGCSVPERMHANVTRLLAAQNLHPVFLGQDHIQNYYEGYSNSTLWPLCHYFFNNIVYDPAFWRAYREVNELFCQKVREVVEPGDMIWVHDYQLMLLPAMLRRHFPRAGIGYFHHIPFPSYELFRSLPQRSEILKGLLGADLIGFHVHDYMRHFLTTLYRVRHKVCHMGEVHLEDRVVEVEAFPMGINYALYNTCSGLPEVRSFARELRQLAGSGKIILSVDRLDYSKGILLRLRSYAEFLEHHPEYRGRVTLIMVVVPSRDTVDMYMELKTKIDELVGSVNGTYADVGWTPVHYFYRSFSFEELAAMYTIADVAVVTPLRDGMNLVAKEYLAAKRESPGVLILSEMAGSAVELEDALIVNPNDTADMEQALLTALTMPRAEQNRRLRRLQRTIAGQDVNSWAQHFLRELETVRDRNAVLRKKILSGPSLRAVRRAYKNARQRLLVLDYDGTLVPFANNPGDARPDAKLLRLLADLAGDRRNKVVVCSGRDKETLEAWLGHLPVGLAAEHGASYREDGLWQEIEDAPHCREVLPLLQRMAEKTPGARIERKRTAVVWHYREVDPWLAELRVNQLIHGLMSPCARLGLRIMRGNKVLEVKTNGHDKGTEIRRLLQQKAYDFVLALGDDVTDEDMFAALPEKAYSVKVGQFSETARFCLQNQERVRSFLAGLARLSSTQEPDAASNTEQTAGQEESVWVPAASSREPFSRSY